MTLIMGDGPVANLPAGLDAYAGYTDQGGIGVTFPGILARFPNALHLSISVHGLAPAMCGDVENGALSSWAGYDYGYTSISNAQAMINKYGRPKKLWTAHYDPVLGAHICSKSIPRCATFGFQDEADGTQWTDHVGIWDESLLADDFFVLDPPDPPDPPIPLLEDDVLYLITAPNRGYAMTNGLQKREITSGSDGSAYGPLKLPSVTVSDNEFDSYPAV